MVHSLADIRAVAFACVDFLILFGDFSLSFFHEILFTQRIVFVNKNLSDIHTKMINSNNNILNTFEFCSFWKVFGYFQIFRVLFQ